MAQDIRTDKITVGNDARQRLTQLLDLTVFPDEIDNAGWDYGTPLDEVKRLVKYWKDDYDWQQAEDRINQHTHYFTSIEVKGFKPLDIHFLHKKSTVSTSIPLLFVHGWPGSFLEGLDILDKLSSGDGRSEPAFDVVVMSLPNFGFSSGVSQRGFALEQYAETAHKLMLKLGYNEYVTQGGDWGFYITRTMAVLYPSHVKATHINFDYGGGAPTFSQYPLLALEHSIKPYSDREKEGLKRTKWFMEESSGYRSIQATKPQTVGYALASSPVSLLSWIYEKLHDWSDAYPWTDEQIITWVSIYWFSRAGPAASLRIYYESTHPWPAANPTSNVSRFRTGEWIEGVKIGYSHQPKELRIVPDTWVRKLGDIVWERYNDKGGHFFAFECPDNLVRDLRDMYRKGAGAHGVVSGRNGYIS